MNLFFREEYFSDGLIKELTPLTKLSWEEANCAPETTYDPDWEKYKQLNDADLLRLFTVRTEVDNDLVGYATFIVAPTLHTRNITFAVHDSMYILKPNRKNGTVKELVGFIEKEFIIDGINSMVVCVMTHRDFSNSLKQLGFKHSESLYIKRLK